MEQEQYAIQDRKKGSRLNYEERKLIEYLWSKNSKTKIRWSQAEIAREVSVHPSTINRELQRGYYLKTVTSLEEVPSYSAYLGQQKADEEKQCHGPSEKIGKDHVLAESIGKSIKEDRYSPYAVIARFENQTGWPTETRICAKTVYRYLSKDIITGCTEQDLPRQGKMFKKHPKSAKNSRLTPVGHSIDDRPPEANERLRAGDMEGDTIVGCKGGSSERLFTATDRKHRLEIIRKIPSGTTDAITDVINTLECSVGSEAFSLLFRTFTPDKGSEFLDWKSIERSFLEPGKQRTALYYAHPGRPCERGTNENLNGMIRRFFPKGTDFALVSDQEVSKVQAWLNNYPRKILGGLSPKQSFLADFKHKPLIASALRAIL
jgi:IS30 family transposase